MPLEQRRADPLGAASAPKQQAIPSEMMEGLYAGAEDWSHLFPDEVNDRLNAQLSGTPDPVRARMAIANNALLSDRLNLTPAEVMERSTDLRDFYGREVLKLDGDIDDKIFYEAAAVQLEKEKQQGILMQDGVAAMVPSILTDDRDEWIEGHLDEMRKDENWDEDKLDLVRQGLGQTWNQIEDLADRYDPEVQQVAAFFESHAKGLTELDKTGTAMTPEDRIKFDEIMRIRTNAETALLSLPPEDRGLILEMAASVAGVEGEERGSFASFGEKFKRGLEGMNEQLMGRFNDGSERSNIRQDMIDRFNYSVDPVRSNTWIGQGMLDMAESLPRTMAAMTAPGLALSSVAQQQQLSREFAENGVTGWKNFALSSATAVPYMLLDRVEANMVFGGKIPFIKNFTQIIKKQSQMKLAALAGRATVQFGVGTVAELGNELVQDAMRPTVQEVIGWIDKSIPEVELLDELKSIGGGSLTTLAALLPLVLVGTVNASFRDVSAGKAYLTNQRHLEAAGFTADQIERIQAAPANTKQAVIKSLMDKREIGTPTQVAAIDSMDAEAAAVEEAVEFNEDPAAGVDLTVPNQIDAIRSGDFEAIGPNPTAFAYKLGLSVQTVEQGQSLADLRDEHYAKRDELFQQAEDMVHGTDEWNQVMNDANGQDLRGQLFNEAFQAATGTGSAVSEGGVKGPFPLKITEKGVLKAAETDEVARPDSAAAESTVSNRSIRQNVPSEGQGKHSITQEENGDLTIRNDRGVKIGTAKTPESAAMIMADSITRKQIAKDRQTAAADADVINRTNSTPSSDGTVVGESTVGLDKESGRQIREDAEMDKLSKPERERWEQVLASAKRQKLNRTADELAAVLIRKPRVTSAAEHAGLTLRLTELQNEYDDLSDQAAVQTDLGNHDLAEEIWLRSEVVWDRMDMITRAGDLAGTEAGRALNMRKMRVNRNDYSLGKLINRMQVAQKKGASAEQKAMLKKMADDLETANAEIARLQDELALEVAKVQEANALTYVEEGIRRRSGAKKKNAVERRKELVGRLVKMQNRLNDVTSTIGMSVETASILAQIADTYIQEGASTLQEVKAKMQNDIPEISDRDIFTALSGHTKVKQKRIVSEAQKRVRELKKQARILKKIEMIQEGIPETKRKASKDSATVRKLRKELSNLRLAADKNARSDKTLQRIHEKINDLQDQIEGGFRYVEDGPKQKTGERFDVAQMRKSMNELKRLMRTEDSISDLEAQLRGDKEFAVSPAEKVEVQNEDLTKALVKRTQLQRQVRNAIEAKRKLTLKESLVEAALVPRTLLATADMSATLRQGAMLSVRRPVLAGKALKQSVGAFVNQNKADTIYHAIVSHPNHSQRLQAGLFLSELDVNTTQREENFLSNWAERIPGYGKVVRASNRHMVTHLNLLRVGVFDKFLADNPDATLETKRAMARYINYASGRGSLGNFNSATKELNTVFFAPRYAVSRFQTLLSPILIKDSTVRKEIAKDFAAYAGTGMSVLLLAAMAGARVGLDPEDSDFGKIIIGNTRIDIWGGLQQPVRLMMSPIVIGLNRTGLKETKRNLDLIDSARRFMSYKLSPAVTIPAQLLTGKSVIGEEMGIIETSLRSVTPLFVQDTIDVWRNNEGIVKAAATAAATFSGIGVNEFEDRSSDEARREKKLKELRKRLGR
jgi:hypothetical protein